MPHSTLKLLPGVDLTKTEALNEAAVSSCQLIRYMRDRGGVALVQKLGGWAKYFPNALPAITRALWAWADTRGNGLLAAGCETSATPGVGAVLQVITNGSRMDITPHVLQDNVAVSVATNTASNVVLITDTGSNISSYDAVFIPAHISVGGVIIFGLYQCSAVSANTYNISLLDAEGNPVFPTSSVTGGAVAAFTTTNGSSTVNVNLANHGFAVGDTYPILISKTLGGLTLVGNYAVQSVVDANNFTIFASNTASSTVTSSINSGQARYDYYLGFGPLPIGSGYGIGGYGVGGYGSGITPAATTGANITTRNWVLDNWGEVLVALPTDTTFGSPDGSTLVGGPLFYWSPEANTYTALPIAAGPFRTNSFFVAMPQRQIIALGTELDGIYDPLLIRWCDVGDFFSWRPSPLNRAGFFHLPRGSLIVGGLQAGQQGVVWTDLAVWAMQYVGGDNPYSFNELGRGCGMIAKKAAAVLQGQTYWMGLTQFFMLGGDGVTPLPCPIWDAVFQNLDTDNAYKIHAAANSSFNELTWYYPSLSGGGEVDSYVKYNTLLGPELGWDYGSLARTAWIDQSVLGQPIGADTNRFIQQHEISNDADGQAMNSWFQTGYFVLEEGNVLTFIDQFWPDMKWGQYGSSPNAQVLLTFYVVEYPGQTPRTYGPFTLQQATTFITPRFRGRLVSLRFESNDVGSFWRIGANRFRFQPDGRFLG